MKNGTILLMTLLLAASAPAWADEPILNMNHTIGTSGWQWRINETDRDNLILYEPASAKPYAKYDISDCLFCSGEDDDCDRDGIIGVPLTDKPKEPVVTAICHVGAHSRRLQIFAPLQNKSKAVFMVTGDYVVDYQLSPSGVTSTFDRIDENGEIVTFRNSWPEK